MALTAPRGTKECDPIKRQRKRAVRGGLVSAFQEMKKKTIMMKTSSRVNKKQGVHRFHICIIQWFSYFLLL
ncbi:hypothetical protein PVK06_016102 [Gossypium arboreum]|uniref:Uncharacterized protein n=1 Tax=Gossypium arboreum TaxID=29729 RepID=A0ABR0PZ90_GOSAR|nr:hypothetical protein PVK06_016102 [Gossypium arboreum]